VVGTLYRFLNGIGNRPRKYVPIIKQKSEPQLKKKLKVEVK